MATIEELRTKWENANQGHVFTFFSSLSPSQQQEFLSQLSAIDLARIESMYRTCENINKVSALEDEIKPLPCVTKLKTKEQKQRWESIGYQAIQDHKVAVILLAGGQGTRLGYDHPKGMYSIGLPSNKSLFQIQAERIQRLKHLANEFSLKTHGKLERKSKLHWYIMTSEATHDETLRFFKEKNNFEFADDEIHFFPQSTLPCTSPSGSILLSSPSSISNAPNGNGGMYAALIEEGILNDMKKKGVEVVFVYGVDNVLVKIADPIFVGSFIESKAEVGSKVVPKASPDERVGVTCLRNGKYEVVEYSEISREMAHQTDEYGNLLFNAANIVTHIFTLNFLEKFTSDYLYELKYHLAVKDIPSIDLKTGKLAPQKGYKYEQFIFDTFMFADSLLALEVDREEEFTAVKNKEGNDSPLTALLQLSRVAKKYIRNAGGVIENDADDDQHIVEISPLISYAGEGLEEIVAGKTFTPPFELK